MAALAEEARVTTSNMQTVPAALCCALAFCQAAWGSWATSKRGLVKQQRAFSPRPAPCRGASRGEGEGRPGRQTLRPELLGLEAVLT